MNKHLLLLIILASIALGGCALKPPNPDNEAETMAVESCREYARNMGDMPGGVLFDMCMDWSGYPRQYRKTVW